MARSSGLEEALWLCPIEDRRGVDSTREGMIAGFTLGNYLLLVDYSGRLFREGKAALSRRNSAACWQSWGALPKVGESRLLKLSEGRLLGRFFAASRQRPQGSGGAVGSATACQPGELPGPLSRHEFRGSP